MTLSLLEKARAGRRAALATLNSRLDQSGVVVSLFEDTPRRREAVPEFRSVRHQETNHAPVLVLTNLVAA